MCAFVDVFCVRVRLCECVLCVHNTSRKVFTAQRVSALERDRRRLTFSYVGFISFNFILKSIASCIHIGMRCPWHFAYYSLHLKLYLQLEYTLSSLSILPPLGPHCTVLLKLPASMLSSL